MNDTGLPVEQANEARLAGALRNARDCMAHTVKRLRDSGTSAEELGGVIARTDATLRETGHARG